MNVDGLEPLLPAVTVADLWEPFGGAIWDDVRENMQKGREEPMLEEKPELVPLESLAGRGLDYAAGREVLGYYVELNESWQRWVLRGGKEQTLLGTGSTAAEPWRYCPEFSTDLNAAMLLVQELCIDNGDWAFRLRKYQGGHSGFFAGFMLYHAPKGAVDYTACSPHAAEAITRAALLTVRGGV